MTYLDTHVFIWLYDDRQEKFPPRVKRLLEGDDLRISPAVVLELSLLAELGRWNSRAEAAVRMLKSSLDLVVCDRAFQEVAHQASGLTWTRDPFDRLIVGQAAAAKAPLITKDEVILDNYALAVW